MSKYFYRCQPFGQAKELHAGSLDPEILSHEEKGFPPGSQSLRGFSPQLSWSHYRALIRVDNTKARPFYLKEKRAGYGEKVRPLGTQLKREFGRGYGIPTKALKQAAKRKPDRFPSDFMFELSEVEKEEVVANCDQFAKLKSSTYLSYAFTEHGAPTCHGPRYYGCISTCWKDFVVFGNKQLIAGIENGITEPICYPMSLHHEFVTGRRRIAEAEYGMLKRQSRYPD